MTVKVDTRGLSCPVPVIKTKQALEKSDRSEVVVLLDEEVAKENVTRLADSLGYTVEAAENAGEFMNGRRNHFSLDSDLMNSLLDRAARITHGILTIGPANKVRAQIVMAYKKPQPFGSR